MTAARRPRKQCAKCPWKVSTDPHDIPNGYNVEKHRALKNTIARGPIESALSKVVRIMACHESDVGREVPCVGWLWNQLREGNNVAVRFAVYQKRIDANIKVDGPQHACLEDTFPRE